MLAVSMQHLMKPHTCIFDPFAPVQIFNRFGITFESATDGVTLNTLKFDDNGLKTKIKG